MKDHYSTYLCKPRKVIKRSAGVIDLGPSDDWGFEVHRQRRSFEASRYISWAEHCIRMIDTHILLMRCDIVRLESFPFNVWPLTYYAESKSKELLDDILGKLRHKEYLRKEITRKTSHLDW